MNLHLVSGFLGSGKTTAIAGAAKQLMAQGKRVGVITNDQGRYLVDTMFLKLADIPTVQVTGGCFCCHYDDLEEQLERIVEQVQPDVVFAESVGSCADIVATVVKPMLELASSPFTPRSLSCFVDARLLHRYLSCLPMPYSDKVVYIFDLQIQEAGLLIINKIDLINQEQRTEIAQLAQQRWPNKLLRSQNSLHEDGVAGWLELLHDDRKSAQSVTGAHSLAGIDYARYGEAEQALAWLDQEILWTVQEGQGRAVAVAFIETLCRALDTMAIGHLKFVVRGGDSTGAKVSFTAQADSAEPTHPSNMVPALPGTMISVLVNARIEGQATELERLVHDAAAETAARMNVTYIENELSAFHAALPKPTHRVE